MIIAYFRPAEDHHESACKFIDPLESFAIHDYVLSEVATVLQLREGHAVAKQAIDFLQSTEGLKFLRLSQEELEMTLDLFLKQNEKISFIDASLLILSRERDLTLVTLDQDLVKCGKKRFPPKH
ncbi:MAG: PIN domain-containing protein [Candidatus Gracilibacteria bacterium]